MPGGRRILHFTVLFSAIFPSPKTTHGFQEGSCPQGLWPYGKKRSAEDETLPSIPPATAEAEENWAPEGEGNLGTRRHFHCSLRPTVQAVQALLPSQERHWAQGPPIPLFSPQESPYLQMPPPPVKFWPRSGFLRERRGGAAAVDQEGPHIRVSEVLQPEPITSYSASGRRAALPSFISLPAAEVALRHAAAAAGRGAGGGACAGAGAQEALAGFGLRDPANRLWGLQRGASPSPQAWTWASPRGVSLRRFPGVQVSQGNEKGKGVGGIVDRWLNGWLLTEPPIAVELRLKKNKNRPHPRGGFGQLGWPEWWGMPLPGNRCVFWGFHSSLPPFLFYSATVDNGLKIEWRKAYKGKVDKGPKWREY